MNKLKKQAEKRKRGNRGDNWKYFDNCPICQAIKEGRVNTMEELKKVFKEAERISVSKVRKNK